ncbi:angiopoietin-related protein 4 [Aquarana catesbeiana]|uniref:angiopoietin-related protein 4 n=1 Tax=Aquarana catesbeiana TaxID=8400 RepID=UPI003CC977CF
MKLFSILMLLISLSGVESWGLSPEKKNQYASWDEMNVIAHGLLQLGHGLKEHVDKTKINLREITGKLNQHNVSMAALLNNAKEVRDSADVLKDRMQKLEQRDKQLQDLTLLLREKLQGVSKDREVLDSRLQNIEEKLRHFEPSNNDNISAKEDVQSIQSQMEIQSKRMSELLEKIKFQQYKLDKQNLQIKNLQSKIQRSKVESQYWRPSLQGNDWFEKNSSHNSAKKKLPSDCHAVFLNGEKSGIFKIQPANAQPFEVYCEITAEAGWTFVQRRIDGSVDFDQLWESYKNGFGNLSGEFWLGLAKMHQIAEQGLYIMHIELQDWEGSIQYMEVHFHLGGPDKAYALQLLGPVTGDLKNALSEFQQQAFSTQDRDQDLQSDVNCAKLLSGGWWFSTCGKSNLNGKYFHSIPRQRRERKQGIFWKTWKGRHYPLKSTVIKIRPLETK